ncbi:T-lymphocyte activation antigen CD80 [Acanthopagrus schlegelii]
MRILLGLCMVLIVTGDEEMTITGTLEGSVLLPCTCLQRNLDKEFLWQMEYPSGILVVKHVKNTSDFLGGYKDRTKLFLHENNNCSILLTNITAGDQGKYRCKYYKKETYMKVFVNLNISASYDVCQNESADNLHVGVSGKTFHCSATGRYGEAEIQWKLDGQLLENSPAIDITHTNTLDNQTGLYQFTSKLITKLDGKPKCDVKAQALSTVIRDNCSTMTDTQKKLVDPVRYRYLKMIPIIFVVVFSVGLWRRGNSHRYQK